MDMKKLQEGGRLAETIQAMKEVEDSLRSSDLDSVTCLLIIRKTEHESISVYGGRGGKFVIEKMFEAGISAAMIVRALAENDLEKL
jgi:hypothetical protein